MSNLVFRNVRHQYDGVNSVDIAHLEVGAGKLVCLLGPSGCGKSTTLRLAAGLESPIEGEVSIEGEVMANDEIFVGPEDRRVGLMFQDYALFPHLTVEDNVAFGLSHLALAERRARAGTMLETVGMAAAARKYPHMLSGGEQQRVALARALAPSPRIILMDEPFSGLDVVLRNRVRDETLKLLKEMGTTVLMVTHDPEEAMRMADEIVVMREGEIMQQGSAGELYNRPADGFIAAFLGEVNRVPARRNGDFYETDLGPIPISAAIGEGAVDEILVRPEAIRFLPVVDPKAPTGEVVLSRNLGAFSLIDIRFESGFQATARVASFYQPKVGDRCSVSLNLSGVFIFPRPGNSE
ncbi:ATP-binding cassette domain-containing protein [Sneathiella chungangensis]|uniref:ATP-binding cassette domain-containing protein n=1 Tax=Sneathiella chungangensis TaxID=1418234 RepID=A0A845MC80_9PROT|nr:ABC transporter ATP-binding protein [Sneathiella chungangensis]MZR21292.1 ATP-binding cassette domain-containing protein [Sneathiella chungangensis]